MAPNLGWRDVPLGDALTRTLLPDVPITIANEADLRPRGARRGVARVSTTSSSSRARWCRRRPDRRRQAARGRGRLRRRGRPYAGQPERQRLPLRIRRVLGDRSGRGRCSALPTPPGGGRGRSMPCSVRRGGLALGAAPGPRRALARRTAGLINILDPRLIVLVVLRAHLPVRRGDGRPRAGSARTRGPPPPRPGGADGARRRRSAAGSRRARLLAIPRRSGRLAAAARRPCRPGERLRR
jgi:hypothetical protein